MTTPLTTQILTALSADEQNGYEIIQTMRADCQGSLFITDSTTYKALRRLTTSGLIAVATTSPNRTTRYRLTSPGRRRLQVEQCRLEQLARLITNRLLR